jgi:hypothetical protein
MKLTAALALSATLAATAAPVVLTTDCTPAQSAVWTQIEQTVLNLLNSQATLAAIESAVDVVDPALAGDIAATDAAIQAAIAFLESVGAIPTPALTLADSIKGQIAAKIAAKGK